MATSCDASRRRDGSSTASQETHHSPCAAPRRASGERGAPLKINMCPWGSVYLGAAAVATAATTQRESATLLATAPSEPAVAPGGAVSQNRLTTGATLRQPFAPTSAQRTLAESVRVPDAHEMSHTAAVFDVTAGRAGRSSFTGRSHKLADGRPGHAGWTYRCVGECLAWLRLWRLISPTSFPRPLTLAAPVLSTQARDKGVGVRHRPRAAPPASRCCVAAGA